MIFFPVFHFRGMIHPYENPSLFVNGFCYLFIINTIVGMISYQPLLYMICWGIILFYEIFILVSYTFKLRSPVLLILLALFVAAIIAVGIHRSFSVHNYNPLIKLDLYGLILAGGLSTYIAIRVVIKNLLIEAMEELFIFFGFSLYCILQVLTSIVIMLDIFEHFDYSIYSIYLLILFWMISLICIHFLKSKYLLKSYI